MKNSIYLKKNEDKRIKGGHLWIFSNEILKIEGEPKNGELSAVFSYQNEYLGTGFYNRNSLIAIRMMTRAREFSVESLLEDRINQAYEFRRGIYPDRCAYRMVFSESDLLPGLIIDRYNRTYVIQINCAGMELLAEMIAEILKDKHQAENIFTSNDNHFRELEGLPLEDRVFLGARGVEIISDAHLKYKIDFARTQKTGFYFDQSDNRESIRKFAEGKLVLDAYCNSGGFGLHSLNAGARHVTFLDISDTEINNVNYNLELNELHRVRNSTLVCMDVFKFLEQCNSDNVQYDIVMVDPPSFTKNKKGIAAALKGYEKMHRLALKALKPGGLLITSSCSHHIDINSYLHTIHAAAVKDQSFIQVLHSAGAAMDHPMLTGMPETAYLKFLICRKLFGGQQTES